MNVIELAPSRLQETSIPEGFEARLPESPPRRVLRILGIRGVPAAHGGFETFAENFALHLVKRGWEVIVYCQEEGTGEIHETQWQGIRRICIPVKGHGTRSTIQFDWKTIRHAARSKDLCLTLGYNTAIFCTWLRFRGVPNLINMDGIEWSRKKWNWMGKTWFFLNEIVGCWIGNHLIADHPEIENHLASRVPRKYISTIPYGAKKIVDADPKILDEFQLQSGRYAILIARPEPENSILEVIKAWSAKPRPIPLVVLGNYQDKVPFQRLARSVASVDVRFVGAIYSKPVVEALRFHARFYIHGHQVGGTNPSLVEALGAGNPILAHQNRFNRWVAGEAGYYFYGEEDCRGMIDELIEDDELIKHLSREARHRHEAGFTFDRVHIGYEALLAAYMLRA